MNIIFPYYSGNIHFSKVIGYVDLDTFVNSIKNPKPRTIDTMLKIKKAELENNIALKRELKQRLYSFTPAVMIKLNEKRNYKNIIEFTGLMQIDMDHIETEFEAVSIKNHLFENYKSIVCAFLSPSGKGVKALLKIDKPKNIDDYKALHQGMVNTFEEYSYLDLVTKNAVLPMFLSIDKDILYRRYDIAETWKQRDFVKPKYVHLNSEPTQTINTPPTSNKERVYKIITKRFNDILDNGHPQVRANALLLGSRVAAGYLSESEAISLGEQMIESNSYLQKNISGYKNTLHWGIKEGLKAPLYF